MADNSANNRVVKNTLMLYIRMFVIMIATLFTSRIVLEKLGIDDFGVYNVVAGMVVSLSIVTNTLSSAIARFITFELARNDVSSLRSVVSTCINAQLVISVVVILIGECLGVWFLNTFLNIPQGSIIAANWVFQASLLIFVVRLLIVPFNAMIVSHEDMKVYAYMSIIDAALLLSIAFLVGAFSSNRLIAYGLLLIIPPVISLIIYICYCKKHYEGCHYERRINKNKFKEIAQFSGWNFLGSSAGVLKNQGVNIIVNFFAGVVANAARGIATQIDHALNLFTGSFTTALNPQIIKSYSSGDISRTNSLISFGARLTFYLMLFITVPLLLEIHTVLKIWLTDIPYQSEIFSQLQFSASLITVLSCTLITGMMATGKIKKYQIVVSAATFMNFPLCIFLLYIGCPIYSTYIVAICLEILTLYLRVRMANKLLGLSVARFFKDVLCNVFIVATVAIVIPLLIRTHMDEGILRLICVLLSSAISSLVSIYFIGFNRRERAYVLNLINSRFHFTAQS